MPSLYAPSQNNKNPLLGLLESASKFEKFFKQKSTWTKKDESLFNVTMVSFNGAEICELVRLYILHQVGLYRDDGPVAL